MRPGKHGGMAASALGEAITRNADFLWIHRAGGDDPDTYTAGLYHSVTGQYVMGVGGGWLREYSYHLEPAYDCACTPGGTCRTGAHGRNLRRGWRNILYELVLKHLVRPTKEVRDLLGDRQAEQAWEGRADLSPGHATEPSWNHSGLSSQASRSA